MPLIGNVLKPVAKSFLIPLELTAAASAIGAAIHKKGLGSGTTTLMILNEELNDIMKIIKSFEESELLIEGVSLLGNLLTGKGTIRAGEGIIRARRGF